jgi:hypothetical protein
MLPPQRTLRKIVRQKPTRRITRSPENEPLAQGSHVDDV